MKRTVTILEDERRITLFRVPKGSPARHQQLGDGLTVFGDGDILVMPFWRRDTEAKCHFAGGRAPNEAKVAAAPQWLLDMAAGDAHLGGAQVGMPRITATPDIRIEDLAYRDRLRPVRPENVAKLAESLKTLGTQTRSISVRPDPERDGKFLIVAGATLFEAAKSLNWTHIRADIMECTEAEARLWEAMENLYRTELTVLEQAEHQAECVRLIAERESVSRQNVAKPQGGRPQGAIAKAAHELPIKGKTQQARRKAIERGIRIAAMSPEAKIAVTGAGLDDNRSALREIAKEETTEAQLAKVEQITKRKGQEHAKRSRVKKAAKVNADEAPSQPVQRHPDDVVFAELRSQCSREFKKTWAEARTPVKRRFLREELKWEGGKPLADKG